MNDTAQTTSTDGQRKKAVLAYSGGLDTSICIAWLKEEYGFDVIAVMGDVGQEHEPNDQIEAKALASGAIECRILNLTEDYACEILTKALAANGLYENRYPLPSALSRPIIAQRLVEIAHEVGATVIAHGCTGKGNDQVRFESEIAALDPSIEVIAPVRTWPLLTRNEEIDWAAAHGIDVPVTKKKPYSIDDNVWGRAIECGVLEDLWNEPPDDIYTMTIDPQAASDEPVDVVIGFEGGLPVSLDGEPMSYLSIIERMNEIAGGAGYGRLDIVENRCVGVKSRECYEAPGALALIEAHQSLESVCLERDLLHYKQGIDQKWAEIVYNGLWFSPLKNALDAFIASTQSCVTGEIKMRFYKGNGVVIGRKSPYSLYDLGLATYDEGDSFDRGAAAGFIALHCLPVKVWAQNRLDEIAEGSEAAKADLADKGLTCCS